MRFPSMWYVRPAKAQASLAYAQSDQSLCLSLDYYMSVKLLTEQLLEVLSLKGGCIGSSESTLVKTPHCWKSRVTAHFHEKSIIILSVPECESNEEVVSTPSAAVSCPNTCKDRNATNNCNRPPSAGCACKTGFIIRYFQFFIYYAYLITGNSAIRTPWPVLWH